MNILENISQYNSQPPTNLHSDSTSLFSTQFQSPSVPKLDMNSPFTSGFSLNSQTPSIAPQIESYLQHIQSQNQREQYRILLLNEIMKLDGSVPLNQPQSLNFSSNNSSLYGQQPQMFPRNNQPNLLDLLNIQQKQPIQMNSSQILSQLSEYNNQLLQTQQFQQQQQQQQQQLLSQNQQQIQQLVGLSSLLPSFVNENNTQLLLQQQQQQQQQQKLHQSQQQYNFLVNAISDKKLPSIISESNSQTKIIVPSQFSETTIDTQQNQGKQQAQQSQQMLNPEGIELERRRQERLEKIEKYKNKRRNWRRKISYDCRKKVADQRLRIKGRFISKKDTEKIKEIIGTSHSEAFNDKKNLRLEFMDNKMRQQNIELNPATSNYEILSQIEELLKKNREIHNFQTMQSVIKKIQKKQLPLFCFVKRHEANMLLRSTKQSEESQDTPIIQL